MIFEVKMYISKSFAWIVHSNDFCWVFWKDWHLRVLAFIHFGVVLVRSEKLSLIVSKLVSL